MFVYFGNTLVNTELVRSVRPVSNGEKMCAEVTFADGTVETLACSMELIEDLEDRLIDAPPGYKAISCFVENNGKMAVVQQEVVAFRYRGAGTDLLPVTPYMMKESAVLSPSGSVATPGAIYDNLSDYLLHKEKDLLPAKRRA